MKLNNENGLMALANLLINKHEAKTSPIDHGTQYVSKSGLVCNVYNTKTILIQNEKADSNLASNIRSLVDMWN
ncbi:conserved hypothetical protein [Vibrio crassostreae]|uniref:hypothetical protein n=1 Tax=Vibrio splendidus TaxID=29497 RepID=UPI0024686E87|nr:hypothetical protein [Vibrio splendidus]CAK2110864.1 conserved hypothetical protein [Vibrio crassostreae]MDH5939706.1 hypothetical protein [Vibrio splendidus]CAK2133859.1 conserved hypothetical protein [Vibrio crassostreae]CAK2991091.1 conserved hypothetical protein [Vibrio crassostreae]CAK3542803.1 conserved hypothetical protein [Vibrio crassostreae]